MGIIQTVWFLCAVLPVLIFLEGWKRFKTLVDERGWWEAVPYGLLAVCVALLIILLALGYR